MKKIYVLMLVVIIMMMVSCTQNGDSIVPEDKVPESAAVRIIAPETASVGDIITVNVLAENWKDVYGFQFDIEYDSKVFKLEQMSESEAMNLFGFPDNVFCVDKDVSFDGKITKIACSRLGDIGGAEVSGTIYTVTFNALSSGSGDFSISNLQVLNPQVEKIDVMSEGATVQVS